MYGLRNCRPMLEGDRFGCTPMGRRVLDADDADDTTSRSNDKQKMVRIATLIALAMLSSATRTDSRLNAVSYHFCGSDVLWRFMNTTPFVTIYMHIDSRCVHFPKTHWSSVHTEQRHIPDPLPFPR